MLSILLVRQEKQMIKMSGRKLEMEKKFNKRYISFCAVAECLIELIEY